MVPGLSEVLPRDVLQIEHVIQAMPATSDIERRNRALIAFILLTGARDGAVSSFKLKHVVITEGKVIQDAKVTPE